MKRTGRTARATRSGAEHKSQAQPNKTTHNFVEHNETRIREPLPYRHLPQGTDHPCHTTARRAATCDLAHRPTPDSPHPADTGPRTRAHTGEVHPNRGRTSALHDARRTPRRSVGISPCTKSEVQLDILYVIKDFDLF